jgi:hypothetical protein
MYPTVLEALNTADVQLVCTCSELVSASCLTTPNGSAIIVIILMKMQKAGHIIKALRALKPTEVNEKIPIDDYLELCTSLSMMKNDEPAMLQQ